MHLLRLELGLLGVEARWLAPLGRDPGREDDDGEHEGPDAGQDRDSVAGEFVHQKPAFLIRLEVGKSHSVEVNVTLVFAPAGVLATALTPGGLNIVDAVRLSIHCATGSKWAELGKVPDSPTDREPIAPATGVVPAELGVAVAVVLAGAPAAPVRLLPVKVLTFRPAGIRLPSWETTAAQSTALPPSTVTWDLAVRSSLLMATTLS